MSRRFRSTERFLKPDPRFRNKVVSKFINGMMWGGKKSVATNIFYRVIGQIEKKLQGVEPLEVFLKAIENVKPKIEVRSKRVGGATYQVPLEVPPRRQQSLAFRWIIGAARNKKGRPMFAKLADELVGAYNSEGEAFKKKQDVHKMAEANRAYAHFGWNR
ncbi:MAG: 30S ribosomal protein S7 [Planctomycetota bacterium]|nr:30S ribosomal protein S7 [Planctomycetota bacterium]